MADQEQGTTGRDDPAQAGEDIPVMQKILDSPFLLLFVGIAIPTILYLIWGILEVASIPLAR